MTGRSRFALVTLPAGTRLIDLLNAPAPTPPVIVYKTDVPGFADRWGQPPGSSGKSGSVYGTYVTNAVAQVGWEDLQPTSGGAINLNAPTYNDNDTKSSTTLQQMMTAVAAAGGTIRLRIMAGIRAPAWAKSIGGAPLPWFYNRTVNGGASSGTQYSIGRWWRTDYQQKYAAFITALAAVIDSNPVITDVSIAGAMTVFDEPMIKQVSDPTAFTPNNRQTLLNTSSESQPYSQAADIAAQKLAIDAHAAFATTRSSLSVNPYQYVVSLASAPSSDTGTAVSLMDYAHTKLGTLAAFGNHSLRDNQQSWDSIASSGPGGDMTAYNRDLIGVLYPKMAALASAGCPVWFQTDAPNRLGRLGSSTPTGLSTVNVDYNDGNGPTPVTGGPALDLALHFLASGVEVPRNYDPGSVVSGTYPAAAKFTSTAQAAAYKAALAALAP